MAINSVCIAIGFLGGKAKTTVERAGWWEHLVILYLHNPETDKCADNCTMLVYSNLAIVDNSEVAKGYALGNRSIHDWDINGCLPKAGKKSEVTKESSCYSTELWSIVWLVQDSAETQQIVRAPSINIDEIPNSANWSVERAISS